MALGDSFTYGVVPYPQAAMTILEMRLRTSCSGQDLDVLNFGISGTGVQDYETIARLGFDTYEPDLMLVNFYALLGTLGLMDQPVLASNAVWSFAPSEVASRGV